jgi:RNA polymerase sigma factor (sigma-70 family)
MPKVNLFKSNLGLATHLAVKFARRNPSFDLSDLVREAQWALWQASRACKIKVAFGAFAINRINWHLIRVVSGSAFDRRKVRMDAEVRRKDGTYLTFSDVIDERHGRASVQSRFAAMNEMGRIHDLETAITTVLTPIERKILILRFFEHLDLKRTARKLRMPRHMAMIHTTRAVHKLRRYFRKRGLKVAAGPLKKIETTR